MESELAGVAGVSGVVKLNDLSIEPSLGITVALDISTDAADVLPATWIGFRSLCFASEPAAASTFNEP
jgi:hypothetical protein